MLYPRPFYSSKFHKKTFEHIDNFIRAILNKLIRKIDGTEQWINLEVFENEYINFIKELKKLDVKIITVSTIYIDDKFFKGSIEQYLRYNEKIKIISQNHNCTYIDLFKEFEEKVLSSSWETYYCKDRFHPNSNGYLTIAEQLNKIIKLVNNDE